MRTHPKIAALLKQKDLSSDYRKAIESADEAHKLSRCYHGHGSCFIPTPTYVLDLMVALLIINGLQFIEGQELDIALMRFMRDYKSAEQHQLNAKMNGHER